MTVIESMDEDEDVEILVVVDVVVFGVVSAGDFIGPGIAGDCGVDDL